MGRVEAFKFYGWLISTFHVTDVLFVDKYSFLDSENRLECNQQVLIRWFGSLESCPILKLLVALDLYH